MKTPRVGKTVVDCGRVLGVGLGLMIGMLMVRNEARAANICVLAGDALGLQAALATAAANDENDLIMLQAGTYDATNLFLKYLPSAHQHDLNISGGYHENPDNNDPCGGIQSFDARDTVINGGRLWMNLPDGAGSISMSSFTLADTFSTAGQNAPIDIQGFFPNSTGSLTIDGMIFRGKVSVDNIGIYLRTEGGALSIANSVFDHNASFGVGTSAIFISNGRPDTSLCTEIIQSTFVDNAAPSASGISLVGTCSPLVANSVFWGNTTGQLTIQAATGYFAEDDVADLSEIVDMQVIDSFSLDPLFKPDFSPSDMSPLREAGAVGVFYSNGVHDVTGSPRIYGAKPDIGAFELQDVIFAHPFDWQIVGG